MSLLWVQDSGEDKATDSENGENGLILFTTSRKPSKNTRRLARAFSCFIPKSVYLTRGKASIKELTEWAKEAGLEKVCVFGEWHGNPGSITFYDLKGEREQVLRIRGSKSKRFRKKQAKVFVGGEKAKWFMKTFLIKECDKNARARIIANEEGVSGFYDREFIFLIKWGDKRGDSKRSAAGSDTASEPPTAA